MHEYTHEYADFIYYSPGQIDKEGRIWPVRGGRNVAKPNYQVGSKRIECFSMHYVRSGAVLFEYGGKQVALQQNDLFCLFPGQACSYRLLSEERGLEMLWLAIDGPGAEKLLETSALTSELPYMKDRKLEGIAGTMDTILCVIEDSAFSTPMISLQLQSLLYQLLQQLAIVSPSTAPSEPVKWIRECRAYMELHALEGITVQQIAATFGVNRSYFSSVFSREMGISPMEYLQKVRMDKAKRLLLETSATVTEIAYSLGYPNLYSFTRAFKTYYSVSPVKYRNNT